MDFVVTGLEFKSRGVQNNKKTGGGFKDWGSIGLGLGIGLWGGGGVSRDRAGGEHVILFEKHLTAPLPHQKKVEKYILLRPKINCNKYMYSMYTVPSVSQNYHTVHMMTGTLE